MSKNTDKSVKLEALDLERLTQIAQYSTLLQCLVNRLLSKWAAIKLLRFSQFILVVSQLASILYSRISPHDQSTLGSSSIDLLKVPKINMLYIQWNLR